MENGQTVTSTFRYGGFKSYWEIGKELEIALEDEKKIYPRDIRWLLKKAFLHVLAGVVLLGMSAILYYNFIGI